MKNLGEFLWYNRKKLGITQEELAERLNTVSPVVSKWENGKSVPDLFTLCVLCNIFKISIEDCINLKNNPNPIMPPNRYDAIGVGQTIKDLRIKNGWSQQEVGQKLFVTSQTVSKWEGGGVTSLDLLQKLAVLYNVSPSMLLRGIENSSPNPEETSSCYSAEESGLLSHDDGQKSSSSKKILVAALALIVAVVVALSALFGVILSGRLQSCNSFGAQQGGGSDSDDDSGEKEYDFVMPVSQVDIIHTHGEYFIENNWYQIHSGLDFAAEVGTEVFAVEVGTIISVGDGTITIYHGEGLVSYYNKVVPEVAVGDEVAKNQLIGRVDDIVWHTDGRHASQCLHFEMYENALLSYNDWGYATVEGDSVDPAKYLPFEE